MTDSLWRKRQEPEALKLALEALETSMYPQQKQLQAITAIKEALAQPEQEPVAIRLWDSQWVNVVNHDNCYQGWDKEDAINHAVKMTEKYIAANIANNTHPPQRKPLTGEQIERILASQPNGEHTNLHWFFNAVRDVEAAHGIKGEA